MKTLNGIITFLVVFTQVSGCGRKSDRKKSQPDIPEAGFVDKNKPAEVDLTNHIIFDKRVTDQAKAGLREDFLWIERYDLNTNASNDKALTEILQVQNLKAGSLTGWLKERIHYLIAEDLSVYKLAAINPGAKQLAIDYIPPAEDPEGNKSLAAAMIGTALFQASGALRRADPKYSYASIDINDEWIDANVLRNGVMQIGPALFNPDAQPSEKVNAYANSAFRVSVLFHEARHADGNFNAGSFGFSHIPCPADAGIAQEFVGKPACDDSANGAYSVGYFVLKAYIAKCGNLCTAREKTVLNSILLDALSRVVKPKDGSALPVRDLTPEKGFPKIDISGFTEIGS
ncbi:MAG TPA: hypothetical protein VE954_18880 [Oligoflexus sp.]|uniref:hypothetical protein n=1 Tax=Oligoflexus sp. TaxID=1971216 RepID=UPI002D40D020|nr:hypothetical protein [Oligoflexus sp.]HYX35166.1 hypothetical protein [Oligoflexus sp.]